MPDCRIEIFVMLATGAKRSAGNREAGWRIERCGLFSSRGTTRLLSMFYFSYELDSKIETLGR